jgi:hypothetical protein
MTAPNLLESSEQAELYLRGSDTLLAQVYDARARGCRTASLQSTPMAERVYAAVGFRDLGRILEYVPVEGER